MKATEIKVSTNKVDADNNKIVISAVGSYNLPETVAEALQTFGEEVVLETFLDAAIVKIQAAGRRKLDAGGTEEEVGKVIADYKFQVGSRKADPVQKFINNLKKSGSSVGSRAEIMAKLQAELAALEADGEPS